MVAHHRLRKQIVSLAALFAAVQPAYAQDHLEPEDSIYTRWYDVEFDRYETIVVSKMKEVFGYTARVIVIPSFQPEFAIALQRQNDGYKLLYLKPELHLWLYEVLQDYESGRITSRDPDGNDSTAEDIQELRDQLRGPLDDVKIERCEQLLDPAIGDRLLALWETALRQTRHPDKETIGLDGVTYHFSGAFDINYMAGKIWSPNNDSPMRELVSIVDMLRDYCLSNDNSILDEVHSRAIALCEEIGCAN